MLNNLYPVLFLIQHLFPSELVVNLRLALAVSSDLVPGKLEQCVDAFETAARGLRDGEPGPYTTYNPLVSP